MLSSHFNCLFPVSASNRPPPMLMSSASLGPWAASLSDFSLLLFLSCFETLKGQGKWKIGSAFLLGFSAMLLLHRLLVLWSWAGVNPLRGFQVSFLCTYLYLLLWWGIAMFCYYPSLCCWLISWFMLFYNFDVGLISEFRVSFSLRSENVVFGHGTFLGIRLGWSSTGDLLGLLALVCFLRSFTSQK